MPATVRARKKAIPPAPPAELCACAIVHEAEVAAARAAMPAPERIEELGSLFRMFADPTRIRLLSALATAELCVCDLGAVLGMSQSAVSHQLALLRSARLVRNRRAGKVIYYSLDDEHVRRLLALGGEHLGESGGRR